MCEQMFQGDLIKHFQFEKLDGDSKSMHGVPGVEIGGCSDLHASAAVAFTGVNRTADGGKK